MNGKAWSPQEVEFLKTAKTPEDITRIAEVLARPRVSVRKKAWQLGMEGVARTFRYWTTKEIALLREHYPSKGPRFVAELLGRPYERVVDQAARMRVVYLRQWSTDEIELLRSASNGKISVETLASRTGRKPSAVKSMANSRRIRLRRAWSDYETEAFRYLYEQGYCLAEIAKIIGYSVDTITRLGRSMGLIEKVHATPLSRKENGILRAACSNGASLDEISRLLKRSTIFIGKAARRLNCVCRLPKECLWLSDVSKKLSMSQEAVMSRLHSHGFGAFRLCIKKRGAFVRHVDVAACFPQASGWGST